MRCPIFLNNQTLVRFQLRSTMHIDIVHSIWGQHQTRYDIRKSDQWQSYIQHLELKWKTRYKKIIIFCVNSKYQHGKKSGLTSAAVIFCPRNRPVVSGLWRQGGRTGQRPITPLPRTCPAFPSLFVCTWSSCGLDFPGLMSTFFPIPEKYISPKKCLRTVHLQQIILFT